MINEITLENFKCFSKPSTFEMSKINLFTGYNGRGKSTILQSLLLMSQSVYAHKTLKRLETVGIFCNLGIFRNLISFGNDSNFVSFTFKGDNQYGKELKISYVEDKDRTGRVSEFWVDGDNLMEGRSELNGTKTESASDVLIYPLGLETYFNNIHYVSANRQGPTPFEEKGPIDPLNPIGINGDHILNKLAGDDSLKRCVSHIISEVMDGGDIVLSGDADNEKNIEILNLYFTSIQGHEHVKSINFGFGYSYVLPIIVAASIMQDGALVIENPEAHLHPQAQSRLMKALVVLAKKRNIQLFVETHSEHVINAIRLCILQKEEEYYISHEDVAIHYFGKDMSSRRLEIMPNAQIPDWPSGFFDQAEKDASLILRLGLFAQ